MTLVYLSPGDLYNIGKAICVAIMLYAIGKLLMR